MRLISFNATDGLRLNGVLALAERNQATIIHIHGSCGNFYENDFIAIMADMYPDAGINFLCVNNRGHDCIAEAYSNGKLVYVGGAYELPEESRYDIEGAIQFAEQLGAPIILQGHSLGCLKALAYVLGSKRPLDVILLSPADTFRLQSNYIRPETISGQLRRIRSEYEHRMDDLLPPREFGVRQNGTEYHIPISARTFMGLFGGSLTDILNYRHPMKYYVPTRGFLYLGGDDPLQTETRAVVERFFLDHIRDLHICYRESGDHHFHGFEHSVVQEIIGWVEIR